MNKTEFQQEATLRAMQALINDSNSAEHICTKAIDLGYTLTQMMYVGHIDEYPQEAKYPRSRSLASIVMENKSNRSYRLLNCLMSSDPLPIVTWGDLWDAYKQDPSMRTFMGIKHMGKACLAYLYELMELEPLKK